MKLLLLPLCLSLLLLSQCEYDKTEPQTSYAITMKATGNSMNFISGKTKDGYFEVTNVPVHLWSVDRQLNGNDTVFLTARQTTDSANPVIVSLKAVNNSQTFFFSDTNATEAHLQVYLK